MGQVTSAVVLRMHPFQLYFNLCIDRKSVCTNLDTFWVPEDISWH
uniref:Uncharacterized protein n=1 Tax=Arundo donax TaxID=35708 RepID=A0A0A9FZB0_ARUDO